AHASLQLTAEAAGWFYLYDSAARQFEVTGHREHRRMLASILTRSRFTSCFRHARGDVLLPRMFEAAASGAVMVGGTFESEDFRRHFDWPDAVVNVGSPEQTG